MGGERGTSFSGPSSITDSLNLNFLPTMISRPSDMPIHTSPGIGIGIGSYKNHGSILRGSMMSDSSCSESINPVVSMSSVSRPSV